MRKSNEEEEAEVEYEANRNRGATVDRPLERTNTKEGDTYEGQLKGTHKHGFGVMT